MHMFITRGKRRTGKYLNIKAGIWKPLLNHPSKSLIKVNSLSFSKQSCIREVRKVKFLLHIKSFNGQNVFTPKFTLKKEVYWIKKVNGRIFVITKLLGRICSLKVGDKRTKVNIPHQTFSKPRETYHLSILFSDFSGKL